MDEDQRLLSPSAGWRNRLPGERKLLGRIRAREHGVILVITLIVLVVLTLAALAFTRSVDTANLVAGNLAFEQAATQSADAAVEAAVLYIQNNPTLLNADDITNGYLASSNNQNPAAGQSWDVFWNATLAQSARTLTPDASGNTVSYVIHRQCAYALPPSQGGNCSTSPLVLSVTGNSEEAGEIQLSGTSSVYYRVTVRVAGPRNTVSYVQAVVAL
jgi:type IV pilus assembly protein PilX